MELVNKLIWAVAVSFLFLSSIYFTFKLRFVQFRLFKVLSCLKTEKSHNDISAKDSLIMSLSSKIGVGSLAGIAFAIYYGGLGSVFWIWVVTFLTSINCFVENILATIYKKVDNNGCQGGPFYYIRYGLKKEKLAFLYAILAIVSYSTGFIAIQNNTMVSLIGDMYNINIVIVSFVIKILSCFVFLKGIKTVSNLCNKIFPIMMFMYLFIGLIVLVKNISFIPELFLNIFYSAFDVKSISGGFLYVMLIGIQKGIFQTEVGVGTSAMISGVSSNIDFIKQGNTGIVSTYFIGFIVSFVTTLIIATSGYGMFSSMNGIELTKYAFNYHFGYIGEVLLLIILVLFAFSTIITVYYYALSNLKGLTNKKLLINILKIVTVLSLFVGGIVSSYVVWKTIDIFVGLLTIINTYSIFMLKDVVVKRVRSSN